MKSIQSVAHLNTEASGVAYAVLRLARSLSEGGCSTQVFSLTVNRTTALQGISHTAFATDPLPLRSLRKLGRSTAMRHALLQEQADVYHTHGLWMMPSIYPAEAARAAGRPFILSPHGMLAREALRYSRIPKLGFWLLWQKNAMSNAACLHATSESELEDIRRLGLKQPIAIIPNGVDMPKLDQKPSKSLETKRPYVLSLGRIHPQKALHRLISAFAQVAHSNQDWLLRIIGPDDGVTSAALLEQVNRLGLTGRVSIEGPVFGDAKLAVLRDAEVFALSSLNENFCIAVAESLASGTPVISTRGAPWSRLSVERCGWWIDHGIEAMTAALSEAMSMREEERRAMGIRGREWMKREFDWRLIAAQMNQLYEWTLGRAEKPSFVFD